MSTVTACPACRTAIPAGQEHCLRCGHAVAASVQPCPACGRRTGSAGSFCAHCGHRLDLPQVSPPTTGVVEPVDTRGVFLPERSYRRPVLIGLAVFGAVTVALTMLRASEWYFFRPQSTVAAYFDALAGRDPAAAGRLLSGGDDDGVTELGRLDPSVLKSSGYTPPADARIGPVVITDNDAVATVSFALGGERHELGLTLRRDEEATAGLFHQWRIVGGVYPLSVRVSGLDAVVIAGATVPVSRGSGSVDVTAFPGAYAVTLPEQPLLAAPETTLYAGVDGTAEIEPTITPTARQEVDRQVAAYLADCAKSTELAPDGCPFSTFVFIDDVDNVRWRISRLPQLTMALLGDGRVDVQTTSPGLAEVSWQEVSSSGTPFDDTDQDDIYVSGVVTVSGDAVEFQPIR